jgi:molybdopterin synthase catalytic subunit
VVTFTGICRADENGEAIAALTLEHYPGMAEAEIARHVEEAQSRWPLLGVTVIHRFGRIAPGEDIVMVATASSHRQAAFAAAEFLMDYLKTRAPFWKQVEKTGGSTWVEAKAADDSAAERWSQSPAPHRKAAE